MVESYIIRIYRRPEQGSGEGAMDGLLENPVSGESQTFHCAEELWQLLCLQPALPASPRTKTQEKPL